MHIQTGPNGEVTISRAFRGLTLVRLDGKKLVIVESDRGYEMRFEDGHLFAIDDNGIHDAYGPIVQGKRANQDVKQSQYIPPPDAPF